MKVGVDGDFNLPRCKCGMVGRMGRLMCWGRTDTSGGARENSRGDNRSWFEDSSILSKEAGDKDV